MHERATAQMSDYEKMLSAAASTLLGFDVCLFQDGDWVCQPTSGMPTLFVGYGATPADAVFDCDARSDWTRS